MTYEEFKKELYRNVLQLEEAQDKGIKLFERKSICADMKDLSIIKALNLACYGFSDAVVHEDFICVLWEKRKKINMMHWKVRPLYERYKQEGWTGILPEFSVKLQQVGRNSERFLKENGTYEESSDCLILRPVNLERCRQSLDNCIYWKYGDFALVLYGLVSDDGDNYITMKIQREYAQSWEVSDKKMLTNALLNSYNKMPPRLFMGNDMSCNPKWEKGVFMPGEKGIPTVIHKGNRWEGIQGYRLTTARRLNGALAIFYPGVKERLAELLGGDYFVGFTSIHEAVIHPVYCKNLQEMKEAIQHVNAVFDEQDMLTNRVYRYSCKRKSLLEV